MNEPIISPWLILLIGNINCLSAMVSLITFISLIWTGIYGSCYYNDESGKVTSPKKFHKFVGVTAILILLNLLIPSRDTAIAMVVASKVTPMAITETKEQVKEMIDYTVDKINSTKK